MKHEHDYIVMATCHCGEVLYVDEVQRRINAAGKLSAEDARSIVAGISSAAAFLGAWADADGATAMCDKLLAYAEARGGDDA